MKKLALLCALAIGQLTSFGSNLGLLYPLGGEQLPGNGTHIFVWTNSANMGCNLYIDWYDTNGTPIVTNSLYSVTLPAGTNTYTFYQPSSYPGADAFQYKIRLEGSDGTTNIEAVSGYVTVTPPASFSGIIENTNQWLPGQNKNIDVSWSGFQVGDTYDVILEAPTLNQVDYGFLMTNLTMGTTSGTQTIGIAYPSNAFSAYPPASFQPVNGTHSFRVANKRCGITQTFGSIDLLTTGLRMYLTPLVFTNVMRGDSVNASKVTLDATLATNSVSVTAVKLVFTSYSTNRVNVACNLMDSSNGIVAMNMLSFRPSDGSNYDSLVTFPSHITLAQGEVRDLTLVCSILGPCELGNFIWNTQGGNTNLQATAMATYVGGGSIPVSVVKSTSAFVSIDEIINPKFSGGSSGGIPFAGGGSIDWSVICKPNTSYLVQSSTNLTSWNNEFVTNTVAGMMRLTLTNANSWCFFRLKEN